MDTGRWNTLIFVFIGIALFFLTFVENYSYWGALFMGAVLIFLVFIVRQKAELIILIVFCILLNAQWGIAQFVVQEDLNLQLIGETKLSVDEVGVAKFGNEKIIRAYGPYKHSNSFAGVVIVGMALLIIARRGGVPVSIWNLFFGVLLIGVLVAFSRAALVSVLILVLISIFRNEEKFTAAHVGMAMVILLLFTFFYIERFNDANDAAIPERVSGYVWSINIIRENGIWRGIWPDSYEKELKVYLDKKGIKYNTWQIDYVHSVPLLIVALVGVMPALAISVVILYLLYKYVTKEKMIILVSVVPLVFLDHYLVTQISPAVFLILLILI